MKRVFILAGVVALALFVGCQIDGPKLSSVSGEVTLDGVPLAGAQVSFNPIKEGKSSASAVTDENGYYSLDFTSSLEGAQPGNYKVAISKVTDSSTGDVETLPSQYNKRTQLEAVVVADRANTFDFALKSK